jgi:hypothetical protein
MPFVVHESVALTLFIDYVSRYNGHNDGSGSRRDQVGTKVGADKYCAWSWKKTGLNWSFTG